MPSLSLATRRRSAAARELGNSRRNSTKRSHPGLLWHCAVDIVAGSLPIALPGLPVPVRLGLAGGPLVLAILLARIGNIGRVVGSMPGNVNSRVRGTRRYPLPCVRRTKSGITVHQHFAFHPAVLLWLVCGALITIIPVLVAGIFGGAVPRAGLRDQSLVCRQVLDGPPPALAFADTIAASHTPADFLRLRLSADHAAPHHGGAVAGHSARRVTWTSKSPVSLRR